MSEKFPHVVFMRNILVAGRGGRITSSIVGRQIVRMQLSVISINDDEPSASVTGEVYHHVRHNTVIYLNR
jgi:hypothetical protein